MKKIFSIKKMCLYLFTFLCIFLATNNVKAIEQVEKKEEYKECKYYNSKTGSHIASLEFNSSEVKFENRANAFGVINFDIQFKASDLNGECPKTLYFGDLNNKYDKVPVKLEYFDGAVLKGEVKSSVVDYYNDLEVEDDGTRKTCNYSEHDTYEISYELVFNSSKAVITTSLPSLGAIRFETEFNGSDLNGECPKQLYLSKASALNIIKVRLKPNDGDKKVRRIVTVGDLAGEEYFDKKTTGEDICEGKTIKIVSSAFNLIRFLVPVIIIIFSVISFVGVVISGESEKMEKAKKNFVLRLVIGFAILIIPAVLELILNLAGLIDSDLATATCNLFK